VFGDQEYNCASVRDISERKRMEDALFFVAQRGWLADAENFFDALAQYLGQKVAVDYVVIDRIDENPGIAETVALYARGAIVPNMRYALKGTPCENVMGRQLCVYPQNVQQQFPEDTLLAEMGVESYIGIPLWDSSGRPIGLIALMNSKPLPDAASATQLLQLVATRAAAELARERSDRILRMREHEFRTLAENLPDNIVRYDREGRTVYVNPVLEKTLGAAAADMIGKQVRENHSDGSYEAYAQALDAALASGENSEMEFILPIPGKEPIVHHIRMIAERDEHGEVTGVLAIGHDITERKRAEEALHLQKIELEEEVAERQMAQESLQEKAFLLEEEIEKRQNAQDELQKLNEKLEQRVKQRTKELEEKNNELHTMNRLFVGRELKMVELKERIKELEGNFRKD
jgi:PAS domain S-box-containing protein